VEPKINLYLGKVEQKIDLYFKKGGDKDLFHVDVEFLKWRDSLMSSFLKSGNNLLLKFSKKWKQSFAQIF